MALVVTSRRRATWLNSGAKNMCIMFCTAHRGLSAKTQALYAAAAVRICFALVLLKAWQHRIRAWREKAA